MSNGDRSEGWLADGSGLEQCLRCGQLFEVSGALHVCNREGPALEVWVDSSPLLPALPTVPDDLRRIAEELRLALADPLFDQEARVRGVMTSARLRLETMAGLLEAADPLLQ